MLTSADGLDIAAEARRTMMNLPFWPTRLGFSQLRVCPAARGARRSLYVLQIPNSVVVLKRFLQTVQPGTTTPLPLPPWATEGGSSTNVPKS
jgi:hypothetical protein